MNRAAALLLSTIGGALLATFMYQIVGLVAFAALMPFGLDDDPWLAMDGGGVLATAIFVLVCGICWVACGWFIPRMLRSRVDSKR